MQACYHSDSLEVDNIVKRDNAVKRKFSPRNYWRQKAIAADNAPEKEIDHRQQFFASNEFFVAIANCTSILKQCTCTQCVYVKNEKIINILRSFPLFFCLFGNNKNCRQNATDQD